jgi:lysophospholipase L1-like esterase
MWHGWLVQPWKMWQALRHGWTSQPCHIRQAAVQGVTMKLASYATLTLLLALAITVCSWSALAAEAPAAPAAKPAAESTAQPAANPAAKWEPAIHAFEKKDKESPPPQGATLFVGSSTFNKWKELEADFKALKAINRGFGGSMLSDLVYYADRIILPYKPRTVVLYGGDNDVTKKSADQVFADYKGLVEKVRKALPETKIYFIAIKPSPARAKVWDKAKAVNQMVKEYAAKTPGLGYIDIVPVMLDADGNPKPELFLKDMLHMNRAGYEFWIPIIKATIEKDAGPPSATPAKP